MNVQNLNVYTRHAVSVVARALGIQDELMVLSLVTLE